MTSTPTKIKVAQDIDLINNSKCFVREILIVEKMDESNFKSLVAFNAKSYEEAVTNYRCDICRSDCTLENPIYTNNEKQGVDLCTKCITKAFESIEAEPGLFPGPVYSLTKICKLNGRV